MMYEDGVRDGAAVLTTVLLGRLQFEKLLGPIDERTLVDYSLSMTYGEPEFGFWARLYDECERMLDEVEPMAKYPGCPCAECSR